MPKGIYKRTKEHKKLSEEQKEYRRNNHWAKDEKKRKIIGEKIRNSKKGMHYKKHKENPMSFKKGSIPWNKGTKGIMPKVWNKEMEKEEYKKHYKKGFGGAVVMNRFGEKHPNWQGGKSFEPYNKTFNNEFKRLIRKRDNQICMLCGIHREKLNRALDIHHINYDKLLSIKENCISLCSSCHTKTGFNRKHWITLFQNLLSEKYNYQYSDIQLPILNVGVLK